MSNWRRYEILLPRKFNDGERVPLALLGETFLDLRRRFGAVSWETQIIHGIWQQQEAEFHDQLVRVFVDVEDKAEHAEFFRRYKEELKSRFRQLDIWMTTYPIDVIQVLDPSPIFCFRRKQRSGFA